MLMDEGMPAPLIASHLGVTVDDMRPWVFSGEVDPAHVADIMAMLAMLSLGSDGDRRDLLEMHDKPRDAWAGYSGMATWEDE